MNVATQRDADTSLLCLLVEALSAESYHLLDRLEELGESISDDPRYDGANSLLSLCLLLRRGDPAAGEFRGLVESRLEERRRANLRAEA